VLPYESIQQLSFDNKFKEQREMVGQGSTGNAVYIFLTEQGLVEAVGLD
jgi:hypothetical protein